jgi:hypothetical protein
MMGEPKLDRKSIFPRLLVEYERNLRNRVQRGEIKEVTLNTYVNDANRVFEALVFVTERTDIEKAMKRYRYGGYYRNVIGHLKQIVEQRCTG